MMPRLRQILSTLLLSSALTAFAASPIPTRTVAAKANANVRAKASVSSEIHFSSKKGQPLRVIGEKEDAKAASDEPKRWAEIVVPAGTRVWVYGALIDPTNKVVRANTVNLRAGPGRNYSDVGSIPRGTPIKELRATDGWLEIEAPEGAARGYVAASLLGEEIRESAVASVTEPPPTPAVANLGAAGAAEKAAADKAAADKKPKAARSGEA